MAEWAVAVMQSRNNCFYVEHFDARWGTEARDALIGSGLVQLLPEVGVLVLAREFRAPEQWMLRYAEQNGEDALRRELRRRRDRRAAMEARTG